MDLYSGYIEKNHGIIKILLDRNESLILIQKKPHQRIPENIKKVEILTKDTFSIAKEGFINVFMVIDTIRCEIPFTANYYRKGQIKVASNIIKKILETVKPMIDFVNSVGINFSLNFEEIFIERDITLREEIESFLKSLSKLVNVQREKDNIKIADYLENQFIEDISRWGKIVKKLLREVGKLSTE